MKGDKFLEGEEPVKYKKQSEEALCDDAEADKRLAAESEAGGQSGSERPPTGWNEEITGM